MLGRIDLGRDGSDAPPLVPSTPLLSPATSTTSLSSLSLLPSPLPALDDSSAATHLVAQVTCKQIKVYGQGLHPRIIAFDCGMKNNIVRCFVKEQRVQVGQGSHTIYHPIAFVGMTDCVPGDGGAVRLRPGGQPAADRVRGEGIFILNSEYFKLRAPSIQVIRSLGIVGDRV